MTAHCSLVDGVVKVSFTGKSISKGSKRFTKSSITTTSSPQIKNIVSGGNKRRYLRKARASTAWWKCRSFDNKPWKTHRRYQQKDMADRVSYRFLPDTLMEEELYHKYTLDDYLEDMASW